MSRRPLVAAVGTLALMIMSGSASAQSKVEFTPYLGLYMPTKAVVADTAGATTIFEVTSGAVFGGRLTYWMGRRFALEGNAGMASSRFILIASGGTTQALEFRASTFMADLRGRMVLTSPGAAASLHLMAGAGITRSANSLFDLAEEIQNFEYKTSIGGVVGIGVSRRIANGLELRIDMEDRIYQANVEGAGIDTDKKTQHDLVFATGLAVRF
jgi:Outer membrane protein beta-barrel domain